MRIRYDNEKLSEILRDLSILTGISLAFLNVTYEEVCSFTQENDFCSAYQAQNSSDRCRHSDCLLLEKCRISGQLEYHFCHAGLYDSTMPVFKSGIIVGYILMGRLRTPASPSHSPFSGSLATLYNHVPFLNDTQLASLRSLLSNILFSNAIEIDYNELAEEISAYILDHLTDTLNISVLCKKFFISKNALYKCFRNYYHMTINDYIMYVRLERAKKLLTETNETVSSICETAGIPNVSYFCRVFKKATGMTPKEYRVK